jgi:hypothetical protein
MTATAEFRNRTVEEILAAHNIPLPCFDSRESGYVTCPECSHLRKPTNQKKEVLHVSVNRDGVQWFCNHCQWHGGEWFKLQDGLRHVASYDYHDEGGRLLFQTARLFPKDFRQRRPDGNGGWIWNLGGVRRVLYRLPELLAAIKKAPDEIVFVVEGEKDVDRLRELGAVATCNPMGASKWREEYTESFRGAETVCVIADKDQPGRAHAEHVAASLSRARVVKHVRGCRTTTTV